MRPTINVKQYKEASNLLKIAGLVNDSIVDGPGLRFTVFVQGCYHKCPGCHNPQSHDPNGGKIMTVDEIFEEIKSNPLLDGVTFSGGEPFQQPKPLADLGIRIKDELNLNIVTYSGYTFEELMRMGYEDHDLDVLRLLTCSDYLVDGKYDQNKKSLECKFRGSYNQRFIDLKESLKKREAIEVEEYKYNPPETKSEGEKGEDTNE